jgi:hypothetical protein
MAARDTLVQRPTAAELEKARTTGQVIGWLQGAATMLVIGVVLKFLGWVPVVLVGAGAAWLAWRMLFRRRK